jgi:ABC-type lipoprotein export system ATPase subunit
MLNPSIVAAHAVRWAAGAELTSHGVDLAIAAGELVAVVGPSRCGKTTLLHLLAGIEQPSEGDITWAQARQPGWAEAALIPQSIALVDELTVEENINFAQRLVEGRRQLIDEELLTTLGLERLRHRLVDEISVGERQRTMAARALVSGAELLLADEPTAHQDLAHARAVVSALRDAARGDRAAVMATRDAANLFGFADRVIDLSPR